MRNHWKEHSPNSIRHNHNVQSNFKTSWCTSSPTSETTTRKTSTKHLRFKNSGSRSIKQLNGPSKRQETNRRGIRNIQPSTKTKISHESSLQSRNSTINLEKTSSRSRRSLLKKWYKLCLKTYDSNNQSKNDNFHQKMKKSIKTEDIFQKKSIYTQNTFETMRMSIKEDHNNNQNALQILNKIPAKIQITHFATLVQTSKYQNQWK